MTTILDIWIENPFSPGLLIVGGVAVLVLLVAIVVSFVAEDGFLAFVGLFTAAILFLFGAVIVSTIDTQDRTGRVEAAIAAQGYSHVSIVNEDITAKAPDGKYVAGLVKKNSTESYTVIFLP